ncbi:hypothetical protein ACLKMH_17190 [Psychromonas sp. KJ10-10]|uniref:hypothetical protein n=1 Tax=Psychromonas sp. KJ10-10 TaxID=3391823 RepID=UPI0039B57956
MRLYEGKKDCLVMEFAGNCYDLFQPELGDPKPNSESEMVTIPCPACQFNNNFWAKVDDNGFVVEHYGRQCQGYKKLEDGSRDICGYRFRAKICELCGEANDIASTTL